ncbi:MAG TPA: toll/interleukin-1 receptor domain-containing protein [Roseiarcus sp.]|nr:toll/interleukin-1 receptor domain-containing protein [Roseiarcus sp.]
MADIFVSYTKSDRDWAFWIAEELKQLGHTPHIHEWEIKGGDDIYAWMEAHHDAAEHVLCVVSDDYLKAPYSTLERNAALWQAASNRPGFVLLVVVKQCRLPTLSDHMRRCDLFGVPEDAARQRFRAFMETRGAPETIALPWPGVRGRQHPDPRADAFHGPRGAAGRDRGGVGPRRGPRRDHRVARAARRRQDGARGRLCRASSRRLSRDLVDPGAK